MNESKPPTCQRCGASMKAGAIDRFCPACLMSGALKVSRDEADPVTPSRSPDAPSPAEFPREFGGYRLLGLLGTGGMGTVYEAEHLSTGRRVALKMLEQQLDSPEMRQRFLREGRLAASVNHPNSLYIFGSEEVEDLPVITMEIAGSGTLKDELRKRGPFPSKPAVDAILDAISGLEAAFAVGVLHRDVKPSNCFVSPDGSVKVGDFGLSVSTLARDDSYATATGVIMGTPAYAPPEQLRGDDLDVRADIYSVGATLFTLLTGKAPFEGKNAVQVVTNVVNSKPKRVGELRDDVPPGLEKVVARCLAKDPAGRFDGYTALRDALLPFSSREPEPASLTVRASAGWIDYLIAFLIPYVILMIAVGNEQFHFRLLLEKTLYSARHHIVFLCCGFAYFALVEGIWGAGLGKRLKGLRVVRPGGGRPGILRALVRIMVPMLTIEIIRIPLLLATVSATHINDVTVFEIVMYSAATTLLPWVPVVLSMKARRENGFATYWDAASGTRVVVKPRGAARPSVESAGSREVPAGDAESFGPYRLIREIVPGRWNLASDPLLRRRIWLLRRDASGPSLARRNLSRSGRLRWLQKVETADNAWDAFEAVQGQPFVELVKGSDHVPWETLRHWLHDLATEIWAATGDQTLPCELSVDHVLITEQGRAVLLDEPWPELAAPAERIPVADIAGQQRFLDALAGCVESSSLPLHARPMLQNLGDGKFEKLSFLTGTLRGLLERPALVSRGIRAGTIFVMPIYVWVMIFVGSLQGAEWLYKIIGDDAASLAMASAMTALGGCALVQLFELPFRTTASHAVFRLAVIDDRGEPARMSRLLARWAIVWLPLVIPVSVVVTLFQNIDGASFALNLALILLWFGAAVHAALNPNRGLHDRMAGTWVVRR